MRISRSSMAAAGSLALAIIVLAALPYLRLDDGGATEEGPWAIIRPPSDVTCMVPLGGTLWVGGKLGVVGISIADHGLVDFPCDVKLSYVRHMVPDHGGLLIGHDNGLTNYTGGICVTLTASDGLVDGRVNYLLRDRGGVLWAGTGQGAYYNDDGGWRRLTTEDGLLNNAVNVMLEDAEGGLWFGSDAAPLGGVSVLRGGVWTYFTTGNGLPHNDVNSLYLDADGSVWAATGLLDRGGAAHFVQSGGEWIISEVLTAEDGLPDGKVRSMYRDPGGVLWIGSENNGLARLEGGSVQVFTQEQGLSHEEVKVMWTDPGGSLWLGTRNGVTVLSPEDLRAISGR